MERKIELITEAFSMQPCSLRICTYDHKHTKNCIEKIKDEVHYPIVNGQQNGYSVYVGYNFEGNQVFEYLATTVNVHYYYE